MAHHDLSISLVSCKSHVDVVSQLSQLFYLKPGDTVNITININCFLYPDYLLLITSALKRLEQNGIIPSGNIIYNNITAGYASRMNFFQNLNAAFNEQYQRQNPHNRFVEISNFDINNDSEYADRVINMLRAHADIDNTVMQGIAFCIGEILGNIYFHSESSNGGWVVAQVYKNKKIRIMVCDTGAGIHSSLTKNPIYASYNEAQCVQNCIVNGVTNGNGMGFGLFAMSRFVQENNGVLLLHSGNSALEITGNRTNFLNLPFWQGTYLFWEVNTDVRVEPGSFTNGYTDYARDYNEKYDGMNFEDGTLW